MERAQHLQLGKKINWIALLVFIVLLVAYYSGLRELLGDEHQVNFFLALVVSVILVPFIAIPAYLSIRETELRRQIRVRLQHEQTEQLQAEESQLARDAGGGPLALGTIWAATQKRIDHYHQVATTQAEDSFAIGKWAMIVGFVAVITIGVAVAFADNATTAIAAGIVGVSGAAMSGYIGATFLRAQAQAQAQLSQFFLQPVEFARLLGAERLLDRLAEEDRPLAVQQIIKSMAPSLSDAMTEVDNRASEKKRGLLGRLMLRR